MLNCNLNLALKLTFIFYQAIFETEIVSFYGKNGRLFIKKNLAIQENC